MANFGLLSRKYAYSSDDNHCILLSSRGLIAVWTKNLLASLWVKLFKNRPAKLGLGRPYHFKFFKGYLPQILLGPFFNTLTHKIP